MQVSVESTGNIGRKMSVSVPTERIDGEVEKRLKDMRGRVKLDGFRPGKVPLSVVSQQYGDSIYQEVISDTFQSTFYEAVNQEDLRVAGFPSIDPDVLEPGKDLKYTATFEIYPSIEVGDMSSLEVARSTATIVDADVDKMIVTLSEQQKAWKDVERAAEKGDLVIVDFDGNLDGESFNGSTAKDFSFEIGAAKTLSNFEEGFLAMTAGEEKEIDVEFPDDYPAAELQGKKVQFQLKLNTVREAVLPEINEDFIKKFGVEDGTEESFRAEIKSNMERELSQTIKARLKQSVMDGLHEMHDIDVPTSLVTEEIKHVRDEMSGNTEADISTLPDELFVEQASRRVRLGLIVGEIITSNGLKKDQQKVADMLQSISSTYEDPAALIKYYQENETAMQTIEAAVMEEMIVDWVLAQAQIKEQTMSFSELMSPDEKKPDSEPEKEQA
ncbi:MAG: trigger factor [Cocleimonas sp.]|nr:trigger factor [Cocleimonas sp.]